MLCPNCSAECPEYDLYCSHCGTDLTKTSTSLVTIRSNLPALLHSPQLPRVAAGVGAVAVGFGLEMLRRSLLTRLAHSSREATKLLPAPTVNGLRDLLTPQESKPAKLPKGYEIQETVVYLRRVIRRED